MTLRCEIKTKSGLKSVVLADYVFGLSGKDPERIIQRSCTLKWELPNAM